MRTPEEVARERVGDGPHVAHYCNCHEPDENDPTADYYRSQECREANKRAVASLADLIRARDAEVRAERRNFRSVPEGMVWQDYYSPDEVTQIREQALAEELAGFTEERKDICGNCGRSPCYARCRQREPNPQRRLVGPWEPVEP